MVVLGLFEALLLIVSVAVWLPVAVGRKLTLSRHVVPAATGLAHVPRVTVNRALFVLADDTERTPGPLLVTVRVRVDVVLRLTFPNASVVGSDIVGRVTPVPDKLTVWGEPTALLLTLRIALFAPVELGANRTVAVHDPPGATVPQLVLDVNWFGFAPERVTLATTRFAVPVFVTVTT